MLRSQENILTQEKNTSRKPISKAFNVILIEKNFIKIFYPLYILDQFRLGFEFKKMK